MSSHFDRPPFDRSALDASAAPRAACEYADLAASVVLGAVEEELAAAFEAHLQPTAEGAGCLPCALELEEARLAVAELDRALLDPPAASAPGLSGDGISGDGALSAALFERVRERIAEREHGTEHADREAADPEVQPWRSWAARASIPSAANGSAAGIRILSASDDVWQTTSIEGIRVRPLHVDEAARRVTMLVRMEPGTSYPAHCHGGVETCFVVEGDLQTASGRLVTGDFERAESGSVHPVQSTVGGCTLLIQSSQDDELLEVR